MDTRYILKKRERNSHKGDYGKILIVAGSRGMVGASILCAKAALRTGTGLCQISIESELFPIIQVGIPEATCLERSILESSNILNSYDAIAVGPGLSTSDRAVEDLINLLSLYQGRLILDADALNIIAEKNIILKDYPSSKVVTPHPGEASRLLSVTRDDIESNRIGAAKEIADVHGAICLLKGSETVIFGASGQGYRINKTGNPGMATAGSGDVLTGIISSLLAQVKENFEAVSLGAYLHGKAGDIAAENRGEYGLIASDIIDAIPLSILSVEG